MRWKARARSRAGVTVPTYLSGIARRVLPTWALDWMVQRARPFPVRFFPNFKAADHCQPVEDRMTTISVIFPFVAVACLIVVIILMIGIGAFAKGGEFNRKHSNRLMRYRIIAQAVAIIIIVGALPTFTVLSEIMVVLSKDLHQDGRCGRNGFGQWCARPNIRQG